MKVGLVKVVCWYYSKTLSESSVTLYSNEVLPKYYLNLDFNKILAWQIKLGDRVLAEFSMISDFNKI